MLLQVKKGDSFFPQNQYIPDPLMDMFSTTSPSYWLAIHGKNCHRSAGGENRWKSMARGNNNGCREGQAH